MRKTILLLSLFYAVSLPGSEQVLREIVWAQLKKEGKLAAGDVLPEEDSAIKAAPLKVVNEKAEPATIPVLTIEEPGITAPYYALSGQVRYEGIEGKAYLEMWSHFPDGGFYFSRTLAETGPMQSLNGTSGWRPFLLPFDASAAAARPVKLVVNVFLPGKGTVYLAPLRLTQGDGGLQAGAWWGNRTAALFGSILGILLGCLGAAVGILSSTGRARKLVIAALQTLLACGAAFLVLGAVALSLSQPYPVYMPLLLAGVLATVLPAILLPTIRKRYEALELRKMQARDA